MVIANANDGRCTQGSANGREPQRLPFLPRREDVELRRERVLRSESGASIPVAYIQRRRPLAVASTNGCWSSSSHNSSSVRNGFVRFIALGCHIHVVEASQPSFRASILMAAMLHRGTLHEEMIGYFRQVQYLLVERRRVPGFKADDESHGGRVSWNSRL